MVSARAAVAVSPGQTEIRDVPLPEIPADAGLLRVLAAGVCGSDIPMYADGSKGPRILGHENVGIIEKLGDEARVRWGVSEGDMVALEEYLPCGHCEDCRAGEYRSCLETDNKLPGSLRYGSTPVDVWPGLWGGYSQFQYLHPRSVLHRVPAGVDPKTGAMALPIGNGFQWAFLDGGAGPGQVVVVQGPGQQGLGCVVAAKAAGAMVIVSGLARDAHRLEVAKRLGADATVVADQSSLLEEVERVSGGKLADLVIDVSSGGSDVVNASLSLLHKRGRMLVAAYKRHGIDGFDCDTVIRKQLTLRGVRGHSFRAVEMALDLMARHTVDLHAMSTHAFDLNDVDTALRTAAGERDPGAIHVTVSPWN